ncbi:arginyl-tRNA synthetase [Theileria orientalis]|uniref:arginine--tRNA ligase n=1 Tax=Theileria orientalis TaxID=68886 RepID=A0A976M6X4_THEOR|nr:arginyl-tRNA synthetase [Theileria orientalis]
MIHILFELTKAYFLILTFQTASCVKNKSENIGNVLSSVAMNGLAGMMYDNSAYQGQLPHIAIKIMPSKKLRLTPTEMNTLLFAVKREIHNKINKLEEELYEHRHDNEKHLSTWALNQAPVYMPFHETVKNKMPNYQKTLTQEVNKLKNKFEETKEEESSEKKIVQQYVRELLSSAISKCSSCEVVQEFAKHPNVCVAKPKFGDYQWSDAMSLFKLAKDHLTVSSPKELAEMVKSNITSDSFSSINVSPQGFMTFVLSNKWIEEELKSLAKNGPSVKQVDKGTRVVIDFSSPNIAKEMHVGHLRSTVIGDSLSRVLEFYGYDVRRINHLGDWGTQFGMLIEYMFEKYPDFMSNMPSISDLTKFYKEAKLRMDADEEFKNRSRRRVVKLQSGEEESRQVWKVLCDISLASFNKIYTRLGIKLENYGESFYNDMIPGVISELKEKGIAVESEGAIVVFTDVSAAPLMLVKSDGGFGYDTTDLACINYRIFEMKSDWIIYVTDIGQSDHFKKLFRTCEMSGWSGNVRIDHVGFGMVQNELGEKFKTRSGDTVKLIDLLDEAVKRSKDELMKRQPDQKNLQRTAEALGYGSIKYFDLNHSVHSNYKFSFDKMLDPRGNTAVYMLYSYARICQIFKKATTSNSDLNEPCEDPEGQLSDNLNDQLNVTESTDPEEDEVTYKVDDLSKLTIEHPTEFSLAKCLLKFPAIMDQIHKDLSINKLTDYLYEISVQFSSFYTQCKVIGDPSQDSRLILCTCTKLVMKTCFNLIGIQPLERI